MSVKAVVESILYKLIFYLNRSDKKSMWSGNFNSWEVVSGFCTGYDNDKILEKCSDAILKVKNGTMPYERDGVLFDHIQYNWALLACLQKISIEQEQQLNVLDFGGSLGSTYFQNKSFLSSLASLKWNIVEQANFVDFGQKHIADKNLSFFYSIDDCLRVSSPDVLLLSSVLQYLPEPYEWLDKFLAANIEYLILDRTAFNKNGRDLLTIQKVPEEIYDASYPAWFFSEENIINKILKKYELIAGFSSPFENDISISEELNVYWKGYFFKLK